jgi:hypothetical protein
MIFGQLWYGWAPRGLEGVNQEQIVAGSGNLGSRASGLTQMVLPWCYYQKTESRGWVERDGVGVAFRRTPTGRDARGRHGAFFVHAIVWESGTMPPALLPGLWDATFWTTRPPVEPPERLEPIRGEAELGLRAAPVVDDETMRLTLAGVLENLAGSRLSALNLPPAPAYGVASRLAAVFPAKFGLISFSSHEDRDRAEAYDLVAGSPSGPHHSLAGPGTQPADEWAEAARLLLLADEGDVQAADLVSLIADRAGSLQEFADRIRLWVALDFTSPPDLTIDPRSLAMLADTPQLVSHLLLDERVRTLAHTFIAGDVVDGIVEVARTTGRADRFFAALREELSSASPDPAIACLLRLGRWPPAQTQALAVTLGESWQGGTLRRLTPEQAVALAELLATRGAPSPVPPTILDELTSAPALAGALACAEPLPAEWRARGAAADPSKIPRQTLASATAYEPGYASVLVKHMDSRGVQVLREAIAEAAMPLAFDCAKQAAAYLEADDERIALVWPPICRLPSHERLEALSHYAQLDVPFSAAWADVTIDALVESVLSIRDGPRALVRVNGRALNVETGPTTDRIEAWRRLSRIVREADPLQVESAARQLAALADAREVDAALEIVVDAVCERAGYRRDLWSASLKAIALTTGESDAELARRLVRATLRKGAGDRATIARWTALWIAEGIDENILPSDMMREPGVETLAGRLTHADIEAIGAYAAQRPRRSVSRRWLKRIDKTTKKRIARRRRQFRSK